MSKQFGYFQPNMLNSHHGVRSDLLPAGDLDKVRITLGAFLLLMRDRPFKGARE